MVETLFLNTQFAFERLPHFLRLKSLGHSALKPYVSINFQNQFYQVKTLDCAKELQEVLRLRFEVFFQEFSTAKLSSFFPYDIDMHDFHCDHLIVKELGSQKIVACYRLMHSDSPRKSSSFYTESEFHLKAFREISGKKLELGRACVHKDFRKGSVIGMLWKGLVNYAQQSDARYLFGCSSLNRKDFAKLGALMDDLKKRDALLTEFPVDVQKKYTIYRKDLSLDFSLPENAEAISIRDINSLMHMYLMAGAKFSPLPAYDAEMDCLDLFTMLDFTRLPASFERRFA